MQVAGGALGGLVSVVVPSPYQKQRHQPMTHPEYVNNLPPDDLQDSNTLNTVVLDMDKLALNDHNESSCGDAKLASELHGNGPSHLIPLSKVTGGATSVQHAIDADPTSLRNESVVCCNSSLNDHIVAPSEQNASCSYFHTHTPLNIVRSNSASSSVNIDHINASFLRLSSDDTVPYIDDDTTEHNRHSSSEVLEAVRGFNSVQSEMMKAIQEAKHATITLAKPDGYRERYCSLSSITSGESLPSLNSLDKFLSSSRCPSNGSSMTSSLISSRNPSPSKAKVNSSRSGSDDSTATKSSTQYFDDLLEQDIEKFHAKPDEQSNSSKTSHYLSSISCDVQLREKNMQDPPLQRPWSFDVSFLKASSSAHKRYSYTPRRLTNVNTLVELAKYASGKLPQRPKTLNLKNIYHTQDNLLLIDNLTEAQLTLTPDEEEACIFSDNSVRMDDLVSNDFSTLGESYSKLHKTPSQLDPVDTYSDFLQPCEPAPCSPFDIPIFVTKAENHNCVRSEVGLHGSHYFPAAERQCLTVKSPTDSSGSDGRTWHDLSTSASDADDNINLHITPLSSPSSPTTEIPLLPPKIDITALRGEIMALKNEILTRKGKASSPTTKDASVQRMFVSSVEDIGSLKNEISALKQDFLSLLDDNAKSNLRSVYKKKPKLLFAGKAQSIDCIDDIRKPKSPCLERISSLDQMVSSDDEDGFLLSQRKSKWSYDTKENNTEKRGSSDVWFQSSNVKLSKGYLAKSKLDSFEVAVPSLDSPLRSCPTPPDVCSLLLRQQVPTCALMTPTVPFNEQFSPSTLRRIGDIVTNSSLESSDSELESVDDSSDDGFGSDSSDDTVELPCSVERVLYGLESPPVTVPLPDGLVCVIPCITISALSALVFPMPKSLLSLALCAINSVSFVCVSFVYALLTRQQILS